MEAHASSGLEGSEDSGLACGSHVARVLVWNSLSVAAAACPIDSRASNGCVNVKVVYADSFALLANKGHDILSRGGKDCGWPSGKRVRRRRGAVPVTISSAGAHFRPPRVPATSTRPEKSLVHSGLSFAEKRSGLRMYHPAAVGNWKLLNETHRCVQPREDGRPTAVVHGASLRELCALVVKPRFQCLSSCFQ